MEKNIHQPLLTVIVPCYNAENYLDKCISSIAGQTYPNLEILLIDDGSTDNTGNICDIWHAKDSRVRVIHKQNEGLPYTRKTGIENATAELVTFVDCDDWIDKNMYTDMIAALLSTNSDIAQCDFCFVYEDGRMEHRVEKHTNSITILGKTEGVKMILKDQTWRVSFWTKIYKKSLFDHITFPKGRMWGEDYINLELFHTATQTVFVDRAYYFYFQRNDSFIRRINIQKDMKMMSDLSDAYHDRYDFVNRHPEYHSYLKDVKYANLFAGILLLHNMIVFPQYFTAEYYHLKVKQMCSISFQKGEIKHRVTNMEVRVLKMGAKWYKLLRTLYIRMCKMKVFNIKTNCHLFSEVELPYYLMYINFWNAFTRLNEYQLAESEKDAPAL